MPDPTRESVSASEVPALFGLSPWLTKYALYERFANDAELPPRENERMRIGKLLQDDILAMVAEDQRIDIEEVPQEGDHYLRCVDPEFRVGATLDARAMCPRRGRGVIETKNIDWLRWKETYSFDEHGICVAGPSYYELQLQTQLATEGASWGCLATLVGGNQLVVLERKPDPHVFKRIREEVDRFFSDVAAGRRPEVTSPIDYELARHLSPRFEAEPPADLRGGDPMGERIAKLGGDLMYWRGIEKRAKDAGTTTRGKLLDLLKERLPGKGVVMTDGGTLTVRQNKDTMTQLHPKVRHALALAVRYVNKDQELDKAIAEAFALEEQVSRKGALVINYKARQDEGEAA